MLYELELLCQYIQMWMNMVHSVVYAPYGLLPGSGMQKQKDPMFKVLSIWQKMVKLLTNVWWQASGIWILVTVKN